MGQTNPYASYRTTQVGTASQLRLIIMLHDGAIRFLQQTIASMEKHDYYNQSINLNKALDIITHLWGSLTMRPGDEIAENMARLFQYMQGRLIQANIDDDRAPILEAISYFRTLRESWEKVDRASSAAEPKTSADGELCKAA